MGFSMKCVSSFKDNNVVSYPCPKKFLPRIHSIPRYSNQYSPPKDYLRGFEAGLTPMHRKKAVAVFNKPEIDDIDKKQLNCTECLSDESDCFWLASDCKSPSFHDANGSLDDWEFGSLDDPVLDRCSSMLSLSESCGVLFDKKSVDPVAVGSRSDPSIKSSLGADRSSGSTKQKHFKDKVAMWLYNTDGNDVEVSLRRLESSDSSLGTSLSERTSLFENSGKSLTTFEDTPSYIPDVDSTDLSVSLLDLEGENTELVQDQGEGLDISYPVFPSPFIASLDVLATPTASSSIASFDLVEDAKRLPEPDEPLFWPFDLNSYGNPEPDSCLCISPRRDGKSPGTQGFNECTPIKARLDEKKNNSEVSKSIIKGRRRIAFSSAPKSPFGSAAFSSAPKSPFGMTAFSSAPKSPSGRTAFSSAPKSPYGRTAFSSAPKSPYGRTAFSSTPKSPSGRTAFISAPESPSVDCKSRGMNNKTVLNLNTTPSRLGGSTLTPAQKQSNISTKQMSLLFRWQADLEAFSKYLLELEASSIKEVAAGKSPIEKFVGLNEFDGHEGISGEFDPDQFTLQISS